MDQLGIAIVVGVLTYAIEEVRRIYREKKIKLSFRTPIKLGKNVRRNSILLVGLGGTGKTSLINRLQWLSEAPTKTRDFDIYEIIFSREKKLKSDGPFKVHLFIADYMGQSFGQIIRAFLDEQQKPVTAMRYGWITTLILIVDIIAADQSHGRVHEIPNQDRIIHHLTQWNDIAIDALFGLLTSDVNLCCLFINKTDLLRNDDSLMLQGAFQPLIKVKRRCPANAKFEVICGSAEKGDGIQDLMKLLISSSVIDEKAYV